MPAAGRNCQCTDRLTPELLGTGPLATSTASVMPVGVVQVARLDRSWNVTSMVLALVVVRLGAGWDSETGVGSPNSTWIGFAVSTPRKVRMPPAEPFDEVNVQV